MTQTQRAPHSTTPSKSAPSPTASAGTGTPSVQLKTAARGLDFAAGEVLMSPPSGGGGAVGQVVQRSANQNAATEHPRWAALRQQYGYWLKAKKLAADTTLSRFAAAFAASPSLATVPKDVQEMWATLRVEVVTLGAHRPSLPAAEQAWAKLMAPPQPTKSPDQKASPKPVAKPNDKAVAKPAPNPDAKPTARAAQKPVGPSSNTTTPKSVEPSLASDVRKLIDKGDYATLSEQLNELRGPDLYELTAAVEATVAKVDHTRLLEMHRAMADAHSRHAIAQAWKVRFYGKPGHAASDAMFRQAHPAVFPTPAMTPAAKGTRPGQPPKTTSSKEVASQEAEQMAKVAKLDSPEALLAAFKDKKTTAALRDAIRKRFVERFLTEAPDLALELGFGGLELTMAVGASKITRDDLLTALSASTQTVVKRALEQAYLARVKKEISEKNPNPDALLDIYNESDREDVKAICRKAYQAWVAKEPRWAGYKWWFGLSKPGEGPPQEAPEEAPISTLTDKQLAELDETFEQARRQAGMAEAASPDDLVAMLDGWFRKLIGKGDLTASIDAKGQLPTSVPGLFFSPGLKLSGGYSKGKFKLKGNVTLGVTGKVDIKVAEVMAELKAALEVEAEGADPRAALRVMMLGVRRRIEALNKKVADLLFGEGPADLKGLKKDDKASLSVGVEGGVSAEGGGSGAGVSVGQKRAYETTGDGKEKTTDSTEAKFDVKGGLVASEGKFTYSKSGADSEMGFSATGTFEHADPAALAQFAAQIASVALGSSNQSDAAKRLGEALKDHARGLVASLVAKGGGDGALKLEVGAKLVNGKWEGVIKLEHSRSVKLSGPIAILEGKSEISTTIKEIAFKE